VDQFEIWAPFAERISVCFNGSARPMEGPDNQNWWRLAVDEAGHGTAYGFLVNDDTTCHPDPRSRWQPDGVHGLSRIYDASAFPWTDAQFKAPPLSSAIIYELHVGTLTPEGTLDAALSRLDYLTDLGITHIELMPIASFEGARGWGYDGVALYAVHEPYGGPDALKRFVNAAHEKGLAVLLDVVYNHFGPSGNYTGIFGPYTTDDHHTPWGGAVNLEGAGSQQVRRFFVDNACMWLRDFHLDGLRIDAVHAFIDRSAIHFLEQIATEVRALEAAVARPLILIAESDLNDPRVVSPREAGGFGFDAQWNDDFQHALFTLLCPQERQGYYADFGSLAHLAKALKHIFVYDGVYSRYRNRVHGRPVGSLPYHRFLGYIQNHDQVGNRAVGDRLNHIAGMNRAKIAASLVMLGPFIPMIFQGEEWAASTPFQYFAAHADRELARSVSEGRRREFAAFGWNSDSVPDPENPATFRASKLNWDELSLSCHSAMLSWYRELIRLRRTTPSLNEGSRGMTHVSFNEDEKWLRMVRGNISVTGNLSELSRAFPVPPGSQIVLASSDSIEIVDGVLRLPTDTVCVQTNPAPLEMPDRFA
jgi:maltooligosyltrehalose trehalohydrolase